MYNVKLTVLRRTEFKRAIRKEAREYPEEGLTYCDSYYEVVSSPPCTIHWILDPIIDAIEEAICEQR